MRTTIVMPPTDDQQREPYATLTFNESDIQEALLQEDELLKVLEANDMLGVWADSIFGQFLLSIRKASRNYG